MQSAENSAHRENMISYRRMLGRTTVMADRKYIIEMIAEEIRRRISTEGISHEIERSVAGARSINKVTNADVFSEGKTALSVVRYGSALSRRDAMDRFVRQANIDSYQKLLVQTADGPARQCIQRLLDEVHEKDRQPHEQE